MLPLIRTYRLMARETRISVFGKHVRLALSRRSRRMAEPSRVNARRREKRNGRGVHATFYYRVARSQRLENKGKGRE